MGGSSSRTVTKTISIYTGNKTKVKNELDVYYGLKNEKNKTVENAEKEIAKYMGVNKQYEEEYKATEKILSDWNREEQLKGYVLIINEKKTQYENANNEIIKAIEKTQVSENLISDFLRVTQMILPIILKQSFQNSNLIEAFDQLYYILDCDCNDKVYIKNYFSENRRCLQCINIFKNEEVDYVEDIEIDEKQYNEEILPLINEGIKQAQNELNNFESDNKNDENKEIKLNELKMNVKQLNFADKIFLKQTCYGNKPWKPQQIQRKKDIEKYLNVFSVIMVEYFDEMSKSMLRSQELLEITKELTNIQIVAISEMKENNNDNNDNINDDIPKELKQIKTVSKYKQSIQKINDNQKLMFLSINNLQLMERNDMKMLFDADKSGTSKIFAMSLQQCCIELIKCNASYRVNVLILMEINSMRPANIDLKTNKFWQTIQNGMDQIWQTITQLMSIFAELFGFFPKFKVAFHKYNEKKNLFHLKDVLSNFLQFKNKYIHILEILNNNAMKTIINCVKQHIGDKNIESAKANIMQYRKEYMNSLNQYENAAKEIDIKYTNYQKHLAFEKEKYKETQKMINVHSNIKREAENTTAIDQKIRELEYQYSNASDYRLETITYTE